MDKFFAPFEWSGEVQTILGIFLEECLENPPSMNDILVILFIITLIVPHVFRILKKNPLKKCAAFFSSENNDIISLGIGCTVILVGVLMSQHGFQGIVPFIPLGIAGFAVLSVV